MRYFLYISYLGTNYHGWQIQKNAHSIQSELNNCLSTLFGVDVKTVGAGRTDTGVHAINQVAHFDHTDRLDNSNFLYKLNSILPLDISANRCVSVPINLHARYDAIERKYIYKIHSRKNPFLSGFSYYYGKQINIENLNKASKLIMSKTNFKSFCKAKSDVKNYKCNIKNAKWTSNDEILVFEIIADRFLRGMVRAIVGTMLNLNEEKINLDDFEKIILSKNRQNAGNSIFSGGLYLNEILYPMDYK